VAIVVRKPDAAALDEATLLAQCGAHLAGFKTPKRVLFVDALPKNPSGKLLKRELRRAHIGLFDRGDGA
jgi:fatty-acyl-CoA synthase